MNFLEFLHILQACESIIYESGHILNTLQMASLHSVQLLTILSHDALNFSEHSSYWLQHVQYTTWSTAKLLVCCFMIMFHIIITIGVFHQWKSTSF